MADNKNDVVENDVYKIDAVEKEEWNAKDEINKLLNSVNPEETDVHVMAAVTHKCLRTISLNDACEYMIRHKLPVNEENLEKYIEITTKAYFLRLDMLKAVLELKTSNN